MTRSGRARLVLLGSGHHARAIFDLAVNALGLEVVGFTEDDASRWGSMVGGVPVLGPDAEVARLYRDGKIDAAFVAVGNTNLPARRKLFDGLTRDGVPVATLVHPDVTVSRSASLGDGSVVFARSVIGAGTRVGRNVVLYSGTVVEHDCLLEDHVYLAPGVVLSGNVTVREGAFLGSGAVVVPGVEIGRDAVVAAGAVVVADVTPGATVMGVPARQKPQQP